VPNRGKTVVCEKVLGEAQQDPLGGDNSLFRRKGAAGNGRREPGGTNSVRGQTKICEGTHHSAPGGGGGGRVEKLAFRTLMPYSR